MTPMTMKAAVARFFLAFWFSLVTLTHPSAEELSTRVADGTASRRLVVDGVRIHYRVSGDRSARAVPPVLFIHGWLGSSYDFGPLLEAFPADLTAIVPDLPGHGSSQKDGIAYSVDFYLEFLHGLLQSLDIPKAIIAGHSMGGGIAVNFAARYPELVEKLVLIDPDGLRGEEGGLGFLRRLGPLVTAGIYLNSRLAVKLAARRTVFHNPAFVTKGYLDAVTKTCLTPEGRRAQIEITKHVLGNAPVDELLGAIRVPVLVIWGEDDRVLSPEWAEEYLSLIHI